MALSKTTTTTLRVPSELRDEISRIAQQRGTSMLEVVTDAVRRLGCDEWWDAVHASLDNMAPDQVESYRAESTTLGRVSSDGVE